MSTHNKKLTSRLLGRNFDPKTDKDVAPSFSENADLFKPLPFTPNSDIPTGSKLASFDSTSSMGSLGSEFSGFDGQSSPGRNSPIVAAENFEDLPEGWRAVASRSVPGTCVFENVHTLERQSWRPTGKASNTESDFGTDAETFLESIKPGLNEQELDKIYNPHDVAAAFLKSKKPDQGGRQWAKGWKEGYEYSKGSPRMARGVTTQTGTKESSTSSTPKTPTSWKATLRRRLTKRVLLTPIPLPAGHGCKTCEKSQVGISVCGECGRKW